MEIYDTFVNLTPNKSVHDYIEDKFHETLINLIKKEVTSCVKTESHESNLLNITARDINFNDTNDNAFITSLRNEVNFLKDEIRSKNKIIELLIENNRKTI